MKRFRVEMMVSRMKAFFAIAVACMAALLAGLGSAEAGGGNGKSHGHHGFGYRPVIVVSTPGPACGYYLRKWKYTGDLYWKAKYYECLYW